MNVLLFDDIFGQKCYLELSILMFAKSHPSKTDG